MSWWISLNDPNTGFCADVESFQEGGTIVVGGSTDADMNVTYNYGKHFDFKHLHGMRARSSILILQRHVESLGKNRDEDYWNPTEGNVGFCLSILLKWAKQYPNYIWRVT